MKRLQFWILKFLKNEDGPTTVEYAIILLTIVATCMGTLVFLGDALNATFQFVSSALSP